ncbi:MAG TPA: biopolymer transporter ExbD [Candidatus Spyradosoma merdigallinarum]|uniref:Biopolymer transporter ExbD n=1 Tax=Candidatus Spyradosoma merdigallinarum TaxID=2840950 RepID=A0A9D1T108_9BACT|nr:biopolymer transporter ExbD [Candidatus Spyradosoma merdigallinarum]
MARNFSRRHKMTPMAEINVTPLLDLCFCLLIIFMIATPVLEQTTRIELPVASSAAGAPASTEQQYRYVALDRHGAYFLDDDAVSADRLRAAFAEIAALPAESQPIVRIRADGQLAYQKVIDVFDMAKKQGLSKVAIDTEVDQAAGAAR